ncbi:biotin-dependent carboxyltransferase family protein [Hyphococcus sp.]|uniref:5-oxoprolinase subunit C family protein n=1 Tax=Hyphococcus sp. TaxID=2038636 RepID=UPI00208A0384|nr:MAG: KipI antagonist [Marinicaulis sp.]
MNPLAEIIDAGMFTTLQDMGRPNARHLGVPLSGAADPLSLSLTNAALGNAAHAAGLECTLIGPTIRFLQAGAIAIGGAEMRARLNKALCPLYKELKVSAGDELALTAAEIGARTYIAFAGGLSGAAFLGSVSTYVPAEIGGYAGRKLEQNDRLFSAKGPVKSPRDIPSEMKLRLAHEFVLRALPGPEAESIGEEETERFFTARWTASRRADRMGAMLEGDRLNLPPSPPISSSPVFPGTVQCPPDGAPFLLLCDAQTVGGYPRIAQVINADLSLTGQIRPGDHVWFRKISADAAREIAEQKTTLYGDLFPGGFFR